MFKDQEIMDHYNQSVHYMLAQGKKKRRCIPLVMMERNIARFTGSKGTEKLGKAARISGNVIRVRRTHHEDT